ncbi:MAG: radical SAM protein [Syntrophaceae bacterium]|nr:radical SAM protein [Syntrophaceae bacterium]
MIAEEQPGDIYTATIYPALPGIDVHSLHEAESSVLHAIPHLRIDTVNACNLNCVFCHTDFSAGIKHMETDDFAFVMSPATLPCLKMITLGCAFEPLLGKHFDEFPSIIQRQRGKITVEIVTNGTLLHKKDLVPWVELGLTKLYVSVFSHIDFVYERTGRGGARLQQIETNLLNVRKRFPNIEIVLVNPVCKANDVDLPGFCRWAFEHIGASSVDIRRAFFVDNPSPGHPAFTYKTAATEELGRSPVLTDVEWKMILQSCSKYISGPPTCLNVPTSEINFDSVRLDPLIRTRIGMAKFLGRISFLFRGIRGTLRV